MFKQKIDLGEGLYKVQDIRGWGIYDSNKDEIIIPCQYSEILYFKPLEICILYGLSPYMKNLKSGKSTFFTGDEVSIVEHKYIKVSKFNKETGKGLLSGLLDSNGNVLVQTKYANIWPGDNAIMVSEGYDYNSRCGCVGKDGYAILEYDSFRPIVLSELDCSEISLSNDLKHNIPYNEVFTSKPRLLLISKNSKYGVVNLDNKIVVPIEYDEIEICEDSDLMPAYFIIKAGGRSGLLNINGKVLFQTIYKDIISHFEHEDEYEELNDEYDNIRIELNEDGGFDFVNANNIEDEEEYEDEMIYDLTDDNDFQEMLHYENFRKGKRVYFELELLDGQKKYLLPNGEPFVSQPYLKPKANDNLSISVPVFPWDSESDIIERQREYLEKQNASTLIEPNNEPEGNETVNTYIQKESSIANPICFPWDDLFNNNSQENDSTSMSSRKTPCKYLFFDTETNGLPADYKAPSTNVNNWPRLLQLSWIVTDENYIVISSNDHFIYPNGFSILADVSALHGITNLKAKQLGEPIERVLDEFITDFNKANFIVGHNIAFDRKIIGAELVRLGRKDVMNSKPTICTMEASTNYCKISSQYGYKWPTLQELHTKLFGCEFEDAHNSMSDTIITLKCFKELKRIGVI